MTGFRVDTTNRTNHFGSEQDVLGRDYIQQTVDAFLVVNTGVEEDVVQYALFQFKALVQRHTAETTPVVRHRTATVRDDHFQLREVLEHVRHHQLLEAGGVSAQVVGTSGVEAVVTGCGYVNHGWNIVLDHFFVDRVEITSAQTAAVPETTGWVRVQVDADEAHFFNRTLDFVNALGWVNAWRLWQLGNRYKVFREQVTHTTDQVVLVLGPEFGGVLVTHVVGHPAGARREDGQVRATFLLQFQLVVNDGLTDFVVSNTEIAFFANKVRVFGNFCFLGIAPCANARRSSGVVSMTIDDHYSSRFF